MPHVCPAWLGPLLLNPLRRLVENPEKILAGLIAEGMTVLEPGCGMGYFTLPIARMVGARGRVVAVDIQPGMLSGLKLRVDKAGLADRVEIRRAAGSKMGVEDLKGTVDLALALHVVHEVDDKALFFTEVREALQGNGRLFIVEPLLHVSRREMEESVSLAAGIGFRSVEQRGGWRGRRAFLEKA